MLSLDVSPSFTLMKDRQFLKLQNGNIIRCELDRQTDRQKAIQKKTGTGERDIHKELAFLLAQPMHRSQIPPTCFNNCSTSPRLVIAVIKSNTH